MRRPDPSDFAPFYAGYVAAVPDAPLLDTLRAQPDALARLVADADPAVAYARGKWTVAQALQHVTDTERVFAFRALWFARSADAPLPPFDQDAWATTASGRSIPDLLAEFRAVREATVALVAGLPDAALDRAGTASGARMTARAAAFVLAGHVEHHMAVFRDQYGLG